MPAAIPVGNRFGRLLGSTQVNELGELESPILLTWTLCLLKGAEGSVGAGTGTIAYQWKGGIGTSSRVTGASGWTVGVLVRANHGGDWLIRGVTGGRGPGRRLATGTCGDSPPAP